MREVYIAVRPQRFLKPLRSILLILLRFCQKLLYLFHTSSLLVFSTSSLILDMRSLQIVGKKHQQRLKVFIDFRVGN